MVSVTSVMGVIGTTSALEKLADRERPRHRRLVVCRRCGIQCGVSCDVPLADVACIGCLRSLAPAAGDGTRTEALSAVADWWDKAAAPGPGYGAVACPHCANVCVVEVGSAARTGCVVCLRPLGSSPLVRSDLTARPEAA